MCELSDLLATVPVYTHYGVDSDGSVNVDDYRAEGLPDPKDVTGYQCKECSTCFDTAIEALEHTTARYYRATITCYDGDHEHVYDGVVLAASHDAALEYMKEAHEYEFGEEKELAWTSFSDGDTSAEVAVWPDSVPLRVVEKALELRLVHDFRAVVN